MTADLKHHLVASTSDRGFDSLPSIPSAYGGEVRVYESSAASGPHIWLKATAPVDLNAPDGPAHTVPIHLTAENAGKLADQIRQLVSGHYQATPDPLAALLAGDEDPARDALAGMSDEELQRHLTAADVLRALALIERAKRRNRAAATTTERTTP